MKKIFVVFCVFFLTGCGNEFICTKETEEDVYKTEEKIVFEFDKNDKITNATVNYIMIFETEEEAESYSNIFKTLNNDFDIDLDGKKITINSTKNYEQYESDKETLKEDLEKDGYTCK